MLKTGDCVIKHPGIYATGMGMVVIIIFSINYQLVKVSYFINDFLLRLMFNLRDYFNQRKRPIC